jgi:2-dehydro-3-deoxygalactonokinase
MVSAFESAAAGPASPEALRLARFVGADWGSTHLRLFLVGDDGRVLATHASNAGASVLTGGAPAFEQALETGAGDWLRERRDLPVIACGMVGSAHGWREVPYATCPARADDLASGTVSLATSTGAVVHLVPGLRHAPLRGAPDVMRGEETQIVGALREHPRLAPRATLVLPGTHSKWVRVEEGAVTHFATHLTGELFALLRGHSVLGRLMPPATGGEAFRADPFIAGVRAARIAGVGELGHLLFSVRTLGLGGQLASADAPDYLSGLLIGSEVVAGLNARARQGGGGAPLALAGEPALCARYVQALTVLEAPVPLLLGNPVVGGLQAVHEALVARGVVRAGGRA